MHPSRTWRWSERGASCDALQAACSHQLCHLQQRPQLQQRPPHSSSVSARAASRAASAALALVAIAVSKDPRRNCTGKQPLSPPASRRFLSHEQHVGQAKSCTGCCMKNTRWATGQTEADSGNAAVHLVHEGEGGGRHADGGVAG